MFLIRYDFIFFLEFGRWLPRPTVESPHLVLSASVVSSLGLVVLYSANAVTCCSGDRGGGTTPGALGGLSAIRPTVHGALLPLCLSSAWLVLRTASFLDASRFPPPFVPLVLQRRR